MIEINDIKECFSKQLQWIKDSYLQDMVVKNPAGREIITEIGGKTLKPFANAKKHRYGF